METNKVITYFIKISPIDLFEFLRTYKDDGGYYKYINWLTRYIADLLSCEWLHKRSLTPLEAMKAVHPENLISFIAHDYKKESWAKISNDWRIFLNRNIPEGSKGEFSMEIDARDVNDYIVSHFEVAKIDYE